MAGGWFVVGGRGRQGRGVIDAAMKLGNEHRPPFIRTVTRSRVPEDDPSRTFPNLQIIENQDMGDADLSTYRSWLQGCTTLFLNLDYWSLGAAAERRIACQWIEAARLAAISFFVYSSLDSCVSLSGGKYPFEAFDNKASVEDDLRRSGLSYCIVKYSTYYDNFLTGHTRAVLDDEGFRVFSLHSDGKCMPFVPVHDAGRVVACILAQPQLFDGQSIGLAAEHLTAREVAEIYTAATGLAAKGVDFPRSDSTPPMWCVRQDHEPHFAQYRRGSLQIVPDLQTLFEFFKEDHQQQCGKKL